MNIKEMTIEELMMLKNDIIQELKLREKQDIKKVIIDLPEFDHRHKNWIKEIISVDSSQSNGYAFQGNFLKAGSTVELAVGTIVMCYYGEGSVKNYTIEVKIYRVAPDGLEDTGISTSRDNRKSGGWALDVRDKLAELFS